MDKFAFKYLPLAALLTVVACSKGAQNDNKPVDPSLTLQDVKAEPVVSMNAITDADGATLKVEAEKGNLIPPSSLIVFDPAHANETKEIREKAIAALASETKSEYDHIKSNCKIVQPSVVVSGDTSGDAGTTKKEIASSSVGGSGCSIDDQEQMKKITRITRTNAEQTVADVSETDTMVLKVISPDLAKNSGISTVNQTVTKSNTSTLYGSGKSSLFTDLSVSRSTDHSDASPTQLEAIGHTFFTMKSADDSAPLTRQYLRINVTKGPIKAVAQLYNDGNTTIYYLNGVKTSQQQIFDRTGIAIGSMQH